MTPSFAWWRNALEGATGPIHENQPQPGYYRIPARHGGRAAAVAIWAEPDGGVRALRDGRLVDASAVWTWCCRTPVTYEVYRAVAEDGEPWPEEIPAIGHNSEAAGLSPAEGLAASIAELWQAAQDWLAGIGTITTQGEADKAGNFAERFAALEKEAEEQRAVAKRPVLAAGRAIDAQWKPVVAAAGEAKTAMKAALAPFLLAERARRAEAGGTDAPPRAGTVGRRVGLRAVRHVRVEDRAALVAHYRDDVRLWASAEVGAVLERLAGDDLAAGRTVPGAALVTEHVAA